MEYEMIQGAVIDELLSSDAGQKIRQIAENVSAVQQGLYALAANEDSAKLDLLKIGTVFQIFFIDVLASGKKASDLTKDDWKNIAVKVGKYAVLEEEQRYSEFVFALYANYIDISAETLREERGKSLADLYRQIYGGNFETTEVTTGGVK